MATLLDSAFGREGYNGGNEPYGGNASHAEWIRTQGKEGDNQATYMKFELSPEQVVALAAGVDVKLVVEQYDIEKGEGDSGSIVASTMASNWDSETVTFSNAPAALDRLGSSQGADGPGQVLLVEVPLKGQVLANAVSDAGVVSIHLTSNGEGAILFRSAKSSEGQKPTLVFPEEEDVATHNCDECGLTREGYNGGDAKYGVGDTHAHYLRLHGGEGDSQTSLIKFHLSADDLAALRLGAPASLLLEQFYEENDSFTPAQDGAFGVSTCGCDWEKEEVTFNTAPAAQVRLGSGKTLPEADANGYVCVALDPSTLAGAADPESGLVSLVLGPIEGNDSLGLVHFRSGAGDAGEGPRLVIGRNKKAEAAAKEQAELEAQVAAAQEAAAGDDGDFEYDEAALIEDSFGRQGYANGTAPYGSTAHREQHGHYVRLNGTYGDNEHTYLKFQLSEDQREALSAGMNARLTLERFETKATCPGDVDVWGCSPEWESETVTFAEEPQRLTEVGELGEAVLTCEAGTEVCVVPLNGAKLLAAANPDGLVSLMLSSDYLSGMTMFSSSRRDGGQGPKLEVQVLSDAGRARSDAAAELARMAAELEAQKLALAQQQAEAALLAANLRMSQMAAAEREAAAAAQAAQAEADAAAAAEEAEEDGWSNKPTVVPAEDFDADADAEVLRKATKGWGTDEKAIVRVLGHRSCAQRQQIIGVYAEKFGRSLIKDMKDELGGNIEDLVVALLMTPAQFDASNLYKFMSGLGTKAHSLAEVLCTRTDPELRAIKASYRQMFGKELADVVRSETAGKFEALLVRLLETERPAGVDPDQAKEDAARLVKTSEGAFFGGNADVWTDILTTRSRRHLRAVFEIFNQEADYDIEEAARRAFSGITQIGRKDFRYAVLILVQSARNPAKYYAKRILEAMKGFGTSHAKLTRVVVARAEIDLLEVIAVFPEVSGGKNLHKWISGDVSGRYKDLLLALVGQ